VSPDQKQDLSLTCSLPRCVFFAFFGTAETKLGHHSIPGGATRRAGRVSGEDSRVMPQSVSPILRRVLDSLRQADIFLSPKLAQSLVKSRAHPNDRDRYANLVSQFMQLVVLLR